MKLVVIAFVMSPLIYGCAGSGGSLVSNDGTLPSPVCAMTSSQYSGHEIQTILGMREEGRSLHEVAKVVGGTRHTVKAVEREAKGSSRCVGFPSMAER